MGTHDPRAEIEKLRAVISSHDKPIALLVGAGASCSVRDNAGEPLIPAVAGLGKECEKAVRAMGPPYDAAWDVIATDAKVLRAHSTIEDILTDVRRKVDAVGPSGSLAGLGHAQLVEVEKTIRQTIAKVARPDELRIPASLPHHALARWIRRTERSTPVEIFTTNYDTLIERGLEDEWVSVFDGFVGSRFPFFESRSLAYQEMAPGRSWARLWKVHGSVNWSWVIGPGGDRRIVRGPENEHGELVLPSSYKYDESRKQPYAAMLERLQRVLVERDDGVLITLGYSFGDDHINSVIFEALQHQDRMHVFALQHSDFPAGHQLIKRASVQRNLVVYGPREAIVGGVCGAWRLREPVDSRTAPLMDIPFDSDAYDPSSTVAPTSGKMRLGDFHWFARFADEIARSHG